MSISHYKAINDDTCGWVHTTAAVKTFPKFNGERQVDWVIIGAGFTGLSAAYRIAELNPEDSVILLDAEQAGKGASSRNSGFIVDITLNDGGATLADENTQLIKNRLNSAGLTLLRDRVNAFGIECDWDESGKFHCAADKRNFAKLENFAAFLERAGLEHKIWTQNQLEQRLGTSYYQYAVQTASGVLVNPAALVNGLVEHLPRNVELFENSPVLHIAQGDAVHVTTAEGSIKADRAILAVNALMPENGYKSSHVFPLTLTASLSRRLSDDEYASIGNPAPWGVLSASSMGATVRLTNDRRILVRNTVEWCPGLTMDSDELAVRRQRNLNGLNKRFPGLTDLDFEYTWSGNVCISRNSKPVFEKQGDNLFIAGCYNAGGVAMGSLFGKLIVDHALNESSEHLEQVLKQEKPARLPPRLFFVPGLKLRLAFNRFQGRSEA